MSGSAVNKRWIQTPISQLTDKLITTLNKRKMFQFPVTVCARHALCVAFQVESLPDRRLRVTIEKNKEAARETVLNMFAGRRAITEACQHAINDLPEVNDESSAGLRNKNLAIRAGVAARLAGYDAAIIYLHALITNDRSFWNRVQPLLADPTRDDILARWEHYTGQPLVGGTEDSTPLPLD